MSIYAELLTTKMHAPRKPELSVSPEIAAAVRRIESGWRIKCRDDGWVVYKTFPTGIREKKTSNPTEALAFYHQKCKEAL